MPPRKKKKKTKVAKKSPLPTFEELWTKWPSTSELPTKDLYSDLQSLDNPKNDWFFKKYSPSNLNTCTVRASLAFNRCGEKHKIKPKNYLGTLKSKDGKTLIAFSSREFREYMVETYGAPDATFPTPFTRSTAGTGFEFDEFSELSRYKGVILFNKKNPPPGEATGHVDVWDGPNSKMKSMNDNGYFVRVGVGTVDIWNAPSAYSLVAALHGKSMDHDVPIVSVSYSVVEYD